MPVAYRRPQQTSAGASRLNLLLLAAFLLLQVLQRAALPLLLRQSAAWGWLLLLPLVFSNSWWAYLHESIHGGAFADQRLNRLVGRVNAALFGAPFDLLRWGHLLHHAHSRSPREASEIYVPARHHRLTFTAGYYFRLFGGLYLLEVLAGLLFLLPAGVIRHLSDRLASPHNLVAPLAQHLLQPGTLAAVRTDMLATLLLYGVAFHLYGPHGWMLLLALWGRGLLISLMDNVFHYGTPLGDTRYAHNLRLPAWASRCILHFNLHGLHHQRPGLPWHQLAQVHRQRGGLYEGNFFKAMLGQLRGPIANDVLTRH